MHTNSILFLLNEARTEIKDFVNLQLCEITKKDSIKLCLINQKSKMIFGFIQASKPGKQEWWNIDKITAFKGYGPTLYEILMMRVYPNWVRPSNLITTSAILVWSHFRNDTITERVNDTNPGVYTSYRLHESDKERTDAEVLDIINLKFKKEPSSDFIDLYANRLHNGQLEWLKRAETQFYQTYQSLNK